MNNPLMKMPIKESIPIMIEETTINVTLSKWSMLTTDLLDSKIWISSIINDISDSSSDLQQTEEKYFEDFTSPFMFKVLLMV